MMQQTPRTIFLHGYAMLCTRYVNKKICIKHPRINHCKKQFTVVKQYLFNTFY